jgi:hypothetical protein
MVESSTIISVIAVIISSFAAITSYIMSKKNNSIPIVVDMFQEFRSESFKNDQKFIFEDLRVIYKPPVGFRELNPVHQRKVMHVSHFYDNLGLLVAHKIVDERLITSFMGEAARMTWDKLEPFIRKERELILKTNGETGDYQTFFEDLVARVVENPPHEIRKNLCLRKCDKNPTKKNPTKFKFLKIKINCLKNKIMFYYKKNW